jgi:hypothetical protein
VTFERAAHEVEHIPGKKSEYQVGQGWDEEKRDEPPPLSIEHQFGDKHHAHEDEFTAQVEQEKDNLTYNKVKRDVRYGKTPEFLFKGVQQTHEASKTK